MFNSRRALYIFLCLCVLDSSFGGLFNIIKICDRRRSLTTTQIKLCNNYFDHMAYIIDGRRIALDECAKQFKGRRWNCTFPEPDIIPFLHPYMPLESRETAFVHAIISAASMYTVSRACMENKLSSYCSCSQEDRPENLPSAHLWKGCGDNLPYGYTFAKRFVDAKEELVDESVEKFSRVLMNLHNNEAGRWAVFDKSKIQCRCHGVSKNCATKTCYRQLSPFNEVGDRLEQLHQSAISVKLLQKGEASNTEMKLVETNSEFNKFSSKDLVYIKRSPSYCERNISNGSFGTRGRRCSQSNLILNECSHLCCGRGHNTKRQIVKQDCSCKFIWCCEVQCKTCEKEENVSYCK